MEYDEESKQAIPVDSWSGNIGLMLDSVTAAYVRQGKRETDARHLAAVAVLAVTDVLGGSQMYMPIGKQVRIELRNLQIWNEFNGRNIADLARRYRLSQRHIWHIIGKYRNQRCQAIDS